MFLSPSTLNTMKELRTKYEPTFNPLMMAFLQQMRSPRLSFIQTVLSLFLGGMALMSSYWCVGQQKVPKPLCTPTKHSNCIPVPGVSNSNIQFSWETGDDRFVFPTFHTGLFLTCEENIYTDAWEEKCRGFYTLTPGSEKAMMWLSLSLELMYIGLLLISCMLLSVQLCIRAWFPSTQRWGQLLNSFAAVFTVLGGLLGMVGHMMYMQVFQTTVSMGPEDFKPHSYVRTMLPVAHPGQARRESRAALTNFPTLNSFNSFNSCEIFHSAGRCSPTRCSHIWPCPA
uniref:Germ cell-specific gene 1-like protein n=2 Tax=Dicentrarchus labrax TaxID=13489 RepID=A0A8C4H7B2_DICLA